MKPAYFEILRDALLLTPRLLETTLATGIDQVRGRHNERLKKFASPQWLGRHMDLGDARVERAWIEEVHSGTATRSRLHIRYTPGTSSSGQPDSIFIKSRAPDFGAALFGKLFELGRNEVAFYDRLRDEVPIKAPRVYHCEGDSRDYVMLLEDLTDQDCQFRTLAEKCSRDDAAAVLTTLARLHAPFWQSKRFETDLAWVNHFETNHDGRLLNLVRQLSVPIAYNQFAELMPEEIREAIPVLMEKYQRLEEEWAREPRTLIHGDAHLGNMYFQDGEVGLLDWQVMQRSQGMRDVAYFLVNSTDTELRRAHQDELIRHYLAELGRHGVKLDFDTAWRQYRLQSVYAWTAGIVTAPSNFQEKSVVASGLTRACNAVLDLEAVELIRDS